LEMDDSRFDRIIREKLEQHQELSAPSATELATMVNNLQAVHAGRSMTQLYKTLIATVALLVFVIIFLTYYTYQLQEDFGELQATMDTIDKQPLTVNSSSNTTLVDSIQSLTVLMVAQKEKMEQIEADLMSLQLLVASTGSKAASRQDYLSLEKKINQLTNVAQERAYTPEEAKARSNPTRHSTTDTASSVLMPSDKNALFELLDPQTQRNMIIEGLEESDILADFVDVLLTDSMVSLQTGTRYSDFLAKKNIPNPDNPDNPDNLSVEEQRLLADLFLQSDPVAVKEAGKQFRLDQMLREQLNSYDKKEGDGREAIVVNEEGSEPSDIVRTKQQKKRDQSWWIGGGAGYGIVETKGFSDARVVPVKLFVEHRTGEHLGFSVGGTYYATTQGQDYIDPTTSEEIEIKLNRAWLDVPLEGRYYFVSDRTWSPFVVASLKARFLLQEEFRAKTYGSSAVLPTFEPGKSFVFPHAGFGLGARFSFKYGLDIAPQLQYSIGNTEFGGYDDRFNSLQGHIYLLYRLD
jgi:cell division protein FtsL